MKKEIEIAYKIDVMGTLQQLKPGEEGFIRTNKIKASSIRSAVRNLRKEGYDYEATEKNLMDRINIKRNS